jgi:hypothetical protein
VPSGFYNLALKIKDLRIENLLLQRKQSCVVGVARETCAHALRESRSRIDGALPRTRAPLDASAAAHERYRRRERARRCNRARSWRRRVCVERRARLLPNLCGRGALTRNAAPAWLTSGRAYGNAPPLVKSSNRASAWQLRAPRTSRARRSYYRWAKGKGSPRTGGPAGRPGHKVSPLPPKRSAHPPAASQLVTLRSEIILSYRRKWDRLTLW